MIYSKLVKMWCVSPTLHTNYIDVMSWCYERWGDHKIDNVRDGLWGYCSGDYYGLTRTLGKLTVNDTRIYFAFSCKEDALFFSLKWA